MEYRSLGRSGLKVSPLCLGTMNFGPQTTESDSFAIMDRALDAGVQFFDTADVYGWQPGEGVTEQILGRWFAQGAGRREKVVLATKVYGGMAKKGENNPNLVSGLSARKIVAGVEGSLKRLQTDHIDLYQMHHIDRGVPAEEVLRAFDILQRQGKIRYLGSSNFAGWDIATYQQVAARHGWLPLISEQSLYNLLHRTIELEVIPACRHYGLGLIPWSPLGGGLLGGVINTKDEEKKRRLQARTPREGPSAVEKHRAQLEQWEALCAELGEEPSVVALAWLLRNPVVTAPIIGPRTIAQLKGALRALEVTIGDETAARLEAIFPGPGGEAPKAYAW